MNLNVEVILEKQAVSLKLLKATDIIWKKRNGTGQHDAFEGCYVLRTDRVDLKEIQRCHLRLSSRSEPDHQLIYHCLGLSGNPLGRRTYAVK